MNIKLYDLLLLKNGESAEVIQVFNPESFLVTSLKGGLPIRINLSEVEGVTSSLFGELDSSLVKFQTLLEQAENRWNEHSSVVKTKKTGSASSSRSSKEPMISLNIDF